MAKVMPRRIVLGFVLALTLVLLIRYSFNNSNTLQPKCECDLQNEPQPQQPNFSSNLEGTRTTHFQSYLEANEKIRKRFQDKRKTDLFEGRKLEGIGLWEHRHGWQYVWNNFPPIFTCPHLVERIGTAKDGGKWICGIELFDITEQKSGRFVEASKASAPCVVYSLGVGWDSSFEAEMVQRTNCSVYAYDYTVDKMDLPSKLGKEFKNRIHFFKLGLGSKSLAEEDKRFRTLKQIMKENGHDWIDFLKVDIEGAEFELLTELNDDFEAIPYGHLNIEIHLDETAGLEDIAKQKKEFVKIFNFWEALESKGLRAWFWEDNYYMCAFENAMPVVMEYSFINVFDTQRNRLIQF